MCVLTHIERGFDQAGASGCSVGRKQNRDHIEADRNVGQAVAGGVPSGQPRKLHALPGGDRLFRPAVAGGEARLDFDEAQHTAIPGNHIDLSQITAHIPACDPVAGLLQQVDRKILSPPTERVRISQAALRPDGTSTGGSRKRRSRAAPPGARACRILYGSGIRSRAAAGGRGPSSGRG